MSSLSGFLRGRGWNVAGSPVPGAGSFTPHHVMLHHYVGSEDPARAAGEAQAARTSFQHSPIYNLYLDVTGRVHAITDGRANHAGRGSGVAAIPTDQGNRFSVGVCAQNDGHTPIRQQPDQYAALMRLCADLLDFIGRPGQTARIIGHKEYAPDRKVDPRDNMTTLRADVAAHLNRPPQPDPFGKDDTMTLIFCREPDGSHSWWLFVGGRLSHCRANELNTWDRLDQVNMDRSLFDRTFAGVPRA